MADQRTAQDRRKHPATVLRELALDPDLKDITSTTVAVACALAHHVNQQGQAWPSVTTMAAEAKCSERSVRSHLANLERIGLIERSEQRLGGPSTVRYSVIVPATVAGTEVPATTAATQDDAATTAYVPATISEVPATGAPNAATTAYELEELEREQGRELGPALYVARDHLLTRNQFEADEIIAWSNSTYGDDVTTQVVHQLHQDGKRFTWASELKRAISNAAASIPKAAWQSCGACVNGMVETDRGVTYCACHPSRTMAATA